MRPLPRYYHPTSETGESPVWEKEIEALLREVEGLTAKYVGRNAEGEQWGETCDRLDRLDKLAKKIRKRQAAL